MSELTPVQEAVLRAAADGRPPRMVAKGANGWGYAAELLGPVNVLTLGKLCRLGYMAPDNDQDGRPYLITEAGREVLAAIERGATEHGE